VQEVSRARCIRELAPRTGQEQKVDRNEGLQRLIDESYEKHKIISGLEPVLKTNIQIGVPEQQVSAENKRERCNTDDGIYKPPLLKKRARLSHSRANPRDC
jgi:hypothetical protein